MFPRQRSYGGKMFSKNKASDIKLQTIQNIVGKVMNPTLRLFDMLIAAQRKVEFFLQKQIIERVYENHCDIFFYSNIFLRPKKMGLIE